MMLSVLYKKELNVPTKSIYFEQVIKTTLNTIQTMAVKQLIENNKFHEKFLNKLKLKNEN